MSSTARYSYRLEFHFPVTLALAAVCLSVFLLQAAPFLPKGLIYYKGAGVNVYLAEGEWWRLVTPMFLHSSFKHLVSNLLALFMLGPLLERHLGGKAFALFYLFAGVAANLLTYWLMPLTYIHAGASSAVLGLLGFYLYAAIFRRPPIPQAYGPLIYLFTGLTILMSFIQPDVNTAGHLAGLGAGFLAAPLFQFFKFRNPAG